MGSLSWPKFLGLRTIFYMRNDYYITHDGVSAMRSIVLIVLTNTIVGKKLCMLHHRYVNFVTFHDFEHAVCRANPKDL